MASNLQRSRARITASATWTSVANAPADHEQMLDVVISNWDADANAILVAITTSSSAPGADTDASFYQSLAAKGSSGDRLSLTGLILKAGEYLWVKSDQTDTRVDVSGVDQLVP